ncbi:MAG: hypothetical protein JW814_11085 [Candidatus Krumholzibacteriota bacterium]|nr:hypothetical protein [Candidatus Krumholzibacteriota bacterium]
MMIGILIIIALLMSINWYYYNQIRSGLDREFSTRLRSLASMVSASVDSNAMAELSDQIDMFGISEEPPAIFHDYSKEFSLSNITVLREDGTIIISLHPGLFQPGDIYPLWNMDYPAIIKALEGDPSSTGLVRSEQGEYFKAGYAPIPPGSESSGLVAAVEANAAFLEGIEDLRKILIASTSVSIAGLLFFILFIIKATRSILRTRESLFQSERLASMGRMAAGIAHEIRNPLFIIRSSAEKLRRTCPGSAKDIDEFILEETDRLDGILTDYLAFAKNEATSRSLCDLALIINRSIRLIEEGTAQRHAIIEYSSSVPESPFVCDEKKIQQALLNILLNAREASEEARAIEVSLETDGVNYTILFRDHGSGIGRKEMSMIFEPFFTTKRNGSGLGLSIAKRIIEDHHGTIDMESTPGLGTAVTVRLPVPDNDGE